MTVPDCMTLHATLVHIYAAVHAQSTYESHLLGDISGTRR